MSATSDTALKAASDLGPQLSDNAQVLTDQDAPQFKESMSRWSVVDVKIPSVIFKPASEEDIVKIVSSAIKNHIPFVPKAGGNSLWSTISSPGWIIDLSLLDSVTIDTTKQTATIQAGVITRRLNETVAKAGFVIQSPTGSGVGYIPFLLNSGASSLAGLYGMASDSMISARVVTATRGLVTASATENEDLFYALKGAGQFFGLVTEVTLKIFPLKDEIISWTCIFLPTQIKDLSKVLEDVFKNVEGKSPGMAGIAAPPGQTKPMIIVSLTHFRPDAEAQKVMEPLLAIKPIQQIKKVIPFERTTDAGEALAKHGGFKRMMSCGLQTFDGKKFEKALDTWTKLVEEFPGAAGCFYIFTWYATEALKSFGEDSSSYSHRDCALWPMAFLSTTDQKSLDAAVKASEELIEFCQADQKEEEKALFPNHSRVLPIEQRYRGEKRRQKLRELKKLWDPEGFFTRQFLD